MVGFRDRRDLGHVFVLERLMILTILMAVNWVLILMKVSHCRDKLSLIFPYTKILMLIIIHPILFPLQILKLIIKIRNLVSKLIIFLLL